MTAHSAHLGGTIRTRIVTLAAAMVLLASCGQGGSAPDVTETSTVAPTSADSTVTVPDLTESSASSPPQTVAETSVPPVTESSPTSTASGSDQSPSSAPPTQPSTPPPTPTPAPGVLVASPTASSVQNAPCPGVRCVTLAMTGDVLLHPELIAQARSDGDGALDFFPMLAAQQRYIESADVGICHLETPLGDPDGPFSNFPSFNVPPQVLPALLETGYDACSTASNHTFDQGTDGIQRTLDDLDSAGLVHDGSYRTEADSRVPVVINTPNGRIGFISVAYDWNGLTLDEPWQANEIDTDAILAKAHQARLAGADLVVVAMHAGEEYESTPNSQQKNAAKTLLASPDIDLIYGHHAHVVQPMEKINGKWAIYGLGNNIAAQGTEITGTRDGLLVRVQFSQDAAGAWTTTDVAWVPSYQDLYAPYRWCALTAGSSCGPDDGENLARTSATVNEWGADTDGAHRLG